MMNLFVLFEDRRLRLITLSVLSIMAFMLIDLRETISGELLRPAIGEPAESGLWGRFASAAALFLAFFLSFGLDFAFVSKKIGFLITQGAVTTIYVSMISIRHRQRHRDDRRNRAFVIQSALLRRLILLNLVLSRPAAADADLPDLPRPAPAGICRRSDPRGHRGLVVVLRRLHGRDLPGGHSGGYDGPGRSRRRSGPETGADLHQGRSTASHAPDRAAHRQPIAMLKDSSLVSVVGVCELTFLAKTAGKSEFKPVEMLITSSLIYWLMSICFELIQSRIEKYYGKSDVR